MIAADKMVRLRVYKRNGEDMLQLVRYQRQELPLAACLLYTSIAFTNKIGYPVVLRPAFTLGGSGGGIAHDEQELIDILSNGLRLSRVGEVLVERCIAGWKEIEYEAVSYTHLDVYKRQQQHNIKWFHSKGL